MNQPRTSTIPYRTTDTTSIQGRLFLWLRWRLFCNSGARLIHHSYIKVISIFVSSMVVWIFLCWGSYLGFSILKESRIPAAGSIVELIFASLFFTLGTMLIFSSVLLMYAALFSGPETRYLLTTPARADHIFAMKFQGAIAFSSWGFLILGGPILVVYGITFEVPWYYYCLLPFFFIGYVLLPASVGACLVLLTVNFFPRKRKQVLIFMLIFLFGLIGYWFYHVVITAKRSMGSRESLSSLFEMFTLASSSLSPSHWISHGLVSAAKANEKEALFSLCFLWSNSLLFYVFVTYLAKKLYRRGYDRVTSGIDLRRTYGSHRLDRWMLFLIRYLDPKTQLLIIKDFRTFRRQPAQIGQLIIFAILLIMGVANSQQVYHSDIPISYQYTLSGMNFAAIGLLISAYLGRFIYPLISLEGQKFWILGLLPIRRDQILWGKFIFAVTGTVMMGNILVLISDLFLMVTLQTVLNHQVVMFFLIAGLNGISVGFSAMLPNFRESDPSKIVAGFGGTLTLILCLLYLGTIFALMVLPLHLWMGLSSLFNEGTHFPMWGYLTFGIGILLALTAIFIPMKLGCRYFNRIEF